MGIKWGELLGRSREVNSMPPPEKILEAKLIQLRNWQESGEGGADSQRAAKIEMLLAEIAQLISSQAIGQDKIEAIARQAGFPEDELGLLVNRIADRKPKAKAARA